MAVPDWEIEGTMDKAQRDALLRALEANRYRVSQAAAQLRIGRSTVYRLIRLYDVEMPEKVEPMPTYTPKQRAPRRAPVPESRKRESTVAGEIVFDGTNYLLVKR